MRALLPPWDAARARRIDPARLAAGTGYSVAQLSDPRERVSWTAFARFLANLGASTSKITSWSRSGPPRSRHRGCARCYCRAAYYLVYPMYTGGHSAPPGRPLSCLSSSTAR